MSRTYVSKALRGRISADAKHRCGYCLTAVAVIGMPMELDHLVPEAMGGRTIENNLWLACSSCNGHKGDRIAGRDPNTGEVVRLFSPRTQIWKEHFRWTADGKQIVGTTPCGRATVATLNLNRPEIIVARRAWASVGWHPPKD